MTTTTTPELLHADHFPLTLRALDNSAYRKQTFLVALATLNEAVASGAIANVRMTECKASIRRALEEAWNRHVQGPLFESQQRGPVLDLCFDIQADSLHLLASNQRKIEASRLAGPMVESMRAVLAEFAPVAKCVEHLKDKVVKRQVKTEAEKEAEERFVPTPATPTATRMAYDALMDITARNHDEMVAWTHKSFRIHVNRFMGGSPDERHAWICDPEYRVPVMAAVSEHNAHRGQYVLRSNWDAALRVLAAEHVARLRDSFVCKVLRKLAPIVEAKGGLQRLVEVADSVRIGSLSGTLRAEFADGSSFLADNTIVYSYSSRGTPFARFPLTFHRVVMPDGSMMKSPCEERMHTVFAATKPESSATDSPEREDDPDRADAPSP